MKPPAPFALDPSEPLSFQVLSHEEPRPFEAAAQVRFELTSRGDRVPGRLQLPTGPIPFPLVITAHDLGGSKDSTATDALFAAWAGRGAAVAAVDLPLHGERASAKLSRRFLALLDGAAVLESFDAELWIDFVRQAVSDLRRSVEALTAHESIDASRVGFAGFGLGSIVGAPFCAEEPRIRAVALARGRGGVGPVAVDPIAHVARLSPRPVLFVDPRPAEPGAEALHEAAGEPKQVQRLDADDDGLEPMWKFLAERLAI